MAIFYVPSKISREIALETTSRDARSLAVGAYLSIILSPSLLIINAPSPLAPSDIRIPFPYSPAHVNVINQ